MNEPVKKKLIMGKIILNAVFILTMISSYGQVAKHSGYYEGNVFKDSSKIEVSFDLKDDSTFLIIMHFEFNNDCSDSGTFFFTGLWTAEKNILYFTDNDLEHYFKQRETRWNKNEKLNSKYQQMGYDFYLKLTLHKKKCTKIFFYIDYDCFEEIWEQSYVEKKDCK